jgi:hypothetical protein
MSSIRIFDLSPEQLTLQGLPGQELSRIYGGAVISGSYQQFSL